MSNSYSPGQPVIPGPTPTGAYEYVTVPTQPVQTWPPVRPDGCQPEQVPNYGPYHDIEYVLMSKRTPADRIDRMDGVRVYRVGVQWLWRFPYDAISVYIFNPPLPQYRFVLNDPTIGYALLNDWTPVW